MGVIKTQSTQKSIISLVGIFIGLISTVWLFPNLMPREYVGLFFTLIATSEVLAQSSLLGITNSTIRYFPYFKDSDDQKKGFMFFLLIVPFFGFLIVFGLFFLLKEPILVHFSKNSPLLTEHYIYVVPITFILVYFEVLHNYSRSLMKSIFPSLIGDIYRRLFLLSLILLFHFADLTIEQFLNILVLGYAVLPLGILLYFSFLNELKIKFILHQKLRSMLKEIIPYALYAVIGGAAGILVSKLDILMIAKMIDLQATAVYTVSFLLGMVINIPAASLLMIALPLVADAWKNNRLDIINDLYKRTALNQLIAGLFIFIVIWINIDNIFFFLPPEYAAGKYVMLFIGIAKLFDMGSGMNGGILLTSKYYRVNFVINLLLIGLTITTNYLLIPILGIEGAALATLISIVSFNVTKFIFLKYKFGFQPFSYNTVKAILVGFVVLVCSYLIPDQDNTYFDIAIRIIYATIAFGGLTLVLKISREINQTVSNQLKRFGK